MALTAQISLEADTLYTMVIELDDIVAHNRFTNDIPQQKTFRWTKTEIEITDGWESTICDNNLCYLPTTVSAEIELGPNASSILDLHLYPNAIYEGYAFIEVKVEHSNDSNTHRTAYYIFDSDLVSSTDHLKPFEFKIYPNPSEGLFTIDNPNAKVASVVVYDMAGQQLHHLTIGKQEWLNLTQLQAGTYLLQLLDEQGAIIGNKLISRI